MGAKKSFASIKTKQLLIGFLLATGMIIATIPLHEATHWVLSEIDPYIEPTEIHLFQISSYSENNNILNSPLGSVIIKEKYPGAFNDRPAWADILQEIICVTLQIIIAVFVVIKTLSYMLKREINKQKNLITA